MVSNFFRRQLGTAPLSATKTVSPKQSASWLGQSLSYSRQHQQRQHLADALIYDGALYLR